MQFFPVAGTSDSTLLSLLEQRVGSWVAISFEFVGNATRVVRSVYKTFRQARKHIQAKGWSGAALYYLNSALEWFQVGWKNHPPVVLVN